MNGSDVDPAALARLRGELAYVTAPQRLGFLVAALGVFMAILRGTALPGLPRVVPAALILTALGLLAIGTIRRVRWHRRRMRGR
ncbi:MAG: hypothetical protein V4537_13385 [Pseudomonadota bacterium]